jgi:plastocyanin domain-containing protein
MKSSTIVIAIAIVLVSGYAFSQRANSGSLSGTELSASTAPSSNVAVENGQQVVTITAKGGYTPTSSTVQAGVPTVIRFNTSGTFDCSAAVRIPDLNVSTTLPSNGSKDISIGTLEAGSVVQGTCGMGMYRFEVQARG